MALTKGEIAKAVTVDSEQRGLAAGKSIVVQVRWPEGDLSELRAAFGDIGLSLSAGVRMACKQWLRDQRR